MNYLDGWDDEPFTPPPATGYCGLCRTGCTRVEPCRHCESQRHVERHDLPRDVVEFYRRRVPGANDPATFDATAQYAHGLLRHWLEVACAVMEDEGVDARTRHRVMSTVAYASVSPPDIVQRDREQAEWARALALKPVTVRVPAGKYEDLLPTVRPPAPDTVGLTTEKPTLARNGAKGDQFVDLAAPVAPPCYIILDPETPHWEQVAVYKVTGTGPHVAWLGLSDTQPIGLMGPHLVGGAVTEEARDA